MYAIRTFLSYINLLSITNNLSVESKILLLWRYKENNGFQECGLDFYTLGYDEYVTKWVHVSSLIFISSFWKMERTKTVAVWLGGLDLGTWRNRQMWWCHVGDQMNICLFWGFRKRAHMLWPTFCRSIGLYSSKYFTWQSFHLCGRGSFNTLKLFLMIDFLKYFILIKNILKMLKYFLYNANFITYTITRKRKTFNNIVPLIPVKNLNFHKF